MWFDLFGLQSLQLVEHSCLARMNRDLNKVIIIIIIIIIIDSNNVKEITLKIRTIYMGDWL